MLALGEGGVGGGSGVGVLVMGVQAIRGRDRVRLGGLDERGRNSQVEEGGLGV